MCRRTWSQIGRVTRISEPSPSRGSAAIWPPCCAGHRPGDGKAEAHALVAARALRAQPPERLKKVVDLVPREPPDRCS